MKPSLRLKPILYCLPAFLFLTPLLHNRPNAPDLVLLPGKKDFTVTTYTDSQPDGKNSRCTIDKATNSQIAFDFAVSKDHLLQGKDAYAGIQIALTGSADSCIDISHYTHVCINVANRQTAYFSIILKTYIEGFSILGNWKTYFFEQSTVQVHEGTEYILPIKDFSPPNWQLRAHLEAGGNRALFLPNKPDLTKLLGIDIKSGPGTLPDQADRFTITKIAFITKPSPLRNIISIGGFGTYLLTALLIGLSRRSGVRRLLHRKFDPIMPTMAKNPIPLFLPAILFLLFLPFHTPEKVIFPSKKKLNIGAYHDSAADGKNSSGKLVENTNSKVALDFTLSKDAFLQGTDPYAALMVSLSATIDSCIDVSHYSHMRIHLVTRRGAYFTVMLKTHIKDFTVFGEWKTYHFEQYTTQVRGEGEYKIPLEKFSPPDWLLKANLESGGPRAMFLPKKADWTKLFGIDIHSGPDVPSDLPDQFSISKISFISESNPILTFIALGGFGSYILIASLLLLFARRRISKDFASTKPSAPGNDEVKKTSLEKTTSETEVGIRLPLEDNCGGKPVASEPVPPYEPKTLISRFDEECKKIESYIGKNFTEPEMNLDMISRNTCVPSWRISEILRKKHDLSFPEYLNAIRIDQAKKYLLDNPDRPIIDIALSVGYGNPNNFDRVFKKLTDISPRLFREKNLPRKEA